MFHIKISLMLILVKQNIALLSHIRPCVKGVAPHNSPIKSIWIIRGPISTLNILKKNHAGHIFRPNQTRHTTPFWLIKRIIKKTSAKSASITLSYFSLITKLINIQMMIPTKERWKVDAFVKISAFSSTALVLVFDWSKSKSNGRNLNFQFAPSWQIVYITTLPSCSPLNLFLSKETNQMELN